MVLYWQRRINFHIVKECLTRVLKPIHERLPARLWTLPATNFVPIAIRLLLCRANEVANSPVSSKFWTNSTQKCMLLFLHGFLAIVAVCCYVWPMHGTQMTKERIGICKINKLRKMLSILHCVDRMTSSVNSRCRTIHTRWTIEI